MEEDTLKDGIGTPSSPDDTPLNNQEGNLAPKADPQEVPERLERVEAALGLLLDHLQTVTKGTEILEASRTRNMFSSIALGFSAIALIVFGGITASDPDISVDVSRFSLGMALLFMASVLDLSSGMILQKAINGAVVRRDPTPLADWQGPWQRFFRIGYWLKIKRQSSSVFYYQLIRAAAFVCYILAGAFLIWAIFYL